VVIRPWVTNCIHAVSNIAEDDPLDTGTAYGVPASEMVVVHFRRWMIEPERTHDQLRARLNLK